MSVSAFGSVAPRDPRRPERGRTMERRHGFRVLCPSWRDGQQPPGRPRDQHARAAPDSELHGLHQHVDDSETTGAAALAREADTPRLRCADPADLGTRESVWPIRSRHEYAIGIALIEMAPGDRLLGLPLYGVRTQNGNLSTVRSALLVDWSANALRRNAQPPSQSSWSNGAKIRNFWDVCDRRV